MGSSAIVNGQPVTVAASPDTPLLWVLRHELGLRAAKFGCGLEQCGACRVLIEDVPRASCQVPIGDLGEQSVTTLEELVQHAEGQRVVNALLERNAGQCGYCLPGIVVTLVHLLRRREPMTRSGLAKALDDHLCRCGSQPRILAAAAGLLCDPCGADDE